MLTKSLDEIKALFDFSQHAGIPMTFRAAGSGLSGQSISNGLLVEVARHWRDVKVEDGGSKFASSPASSERAPTSYWRPTVPRSVPTMPEWGSDA